MMDATDSKIRFKVPADSLVLVGSLDVSGAAHSLLISTNSDEPRLACGGPSSHGVVDLEYIDMASCSDPGRRFQQLKSCSPASAVTDKTMTAERRISIRALVDEPARRFLVPHFEFDQIVQQPCEAVPLVEGSRVKVYFDPGLFGNSDVQQHRNLSEEAIRVCTTIESDVLPLIESWIGLITDLDADQRLSVVLTDLDRRESSSDTPVLGCVRRGDFSADNQNSLAGDIVYLDRHLPQGEQLRALLAHELTHAAVFCICHEATHDSPLKNHSVPSWLNEAAAHWVEGQFCSTPAGYAAREIAFRQNPSQCPIMMRDDDNHSPARRTGSRVAGLTFLQQHITDVHELRTILEQCTPFEQSISRIAESSFSQLFRQWTIGQACADHNESLPGNSVITGGSLNTADDRPARYRLHGTAFLILRSDFEKSVTIEARGDAQLQITVLHQANLLNTQHPRDILTAERLQTADLGSLSNPGIR
ncbi:MAG: hypothetical protein U0936_02340 [Planctomycetaceae bacterium]